MKKVIFTQRVEIVEGYNERRDCADQNIVRFIRECGYMPLPISNFMEYVRDYLESIEPDGVVFTGGNTLQSYGGDAPERDLVEQFLIKWAQNKKIPLLGFCRGMQVIADFYGAHLIPVKNHTSTRHILNGGFIREVNSYHNFGFMDLPHELEALARADDGVIEAFKHKNNAIYGIMWHPEREKPFSAEDVKLFRRVFE